MSDNPCRGAIERGGETLTPEEVDQISAIVAAERDRLMAEGRMADLKDRLLDVARDEGEKARLAAALKRRHAALSSMARDRVTEMVDAHITAGLTPEKAVLAVLEGTSRGVAGGRKSVAATIEAYEARHAGDMIATLQRDQPHVLRMLEDRSYLDDVVREMYELRDGGTPGVTGNADARKTARTFAAFGEVSRKDLNRLGASIGKLDGWAGPQVHDPFRVMAVSKQDWIRAILPHLDHDRTFGRDKDPDAFLGHAYDSITTGRDNTPSALADGEVSGPANLAKSLEKHRVLHFKSADDWLAYNSAFGHGHIVSAMLAHQQRAARLAGQMHVLGPNPEATMQRLLRDLNARRDAGAKQLDLGTDTAIGSSFAEVRGLTLAPVNLTMAQIGSGVRAGQSMSKLGGAVISSVTDMPTNVANLSFHGKPLGEAWAGQFRELMDGRGDAEQREIAYLLGQGFDGLIGHVVSPYVAGDGAPGMMSRAMETFFRWSGQTWWTDAMRSGAARMLSAHVGSQTGKGWADLPAAFRHGLTLHGITEAEWTVIRQGQFRTHDGAVYVTPDRTRDLGEEAIRSLIPAADLAAAKATFPTPEGFDRWMTRRVAETRLDLELSLRRYFADETSFAVLEPGAQERRMMKMGTRPGTVLGEALRFFWQFKGFPLVFGNRVLGRALRGGEGGRAAGAKHIGHLMGTLMVAGYAAMTAKDVLRGWWPPRDPTDPNTMLAAFVQGGGAGIYGDYLFGKANRFGNGPLEALAGPTISTAASVVQLMQQAREGEARAGDGLNILLQNTPYLNLWYTRPALDYLILGSLYESVRPGYLQRQEQARRKENGQRRFWDGY